MKKVVVLINDTTYAYNLRTAIFRELLSQRFEVVIVGRLLRHVDQLAEIGCRLINVETDRQHANPLSDFMLIIRYFCILKKENPDVVLTYNIKPNVYGGIICKQLQIPYIVNVTGLGKPLGTSGLLEIVARRLYKYGISKSQCVFFQNKSNLQYFLKHKLLKGQKRYLLPGSGVDLDYYTYTELPEDEEIHFLFAARIIKEKGVDYILAAAEKNTNKKIVFDICGSCEDKQYYQKLTNISSIHYHGEQDDLRPFYQRCICFLFPSYYPEGLSNVLLEACASGRPIITTANPGCQEIVEDGVNGYLIPANNQEELDVAIKKYLALSIDQKKNMGYEARRIVEAKYDRKQVVIKYMEIINQIVHDV